MKKLFIFFFLSLVSAMAYAGTPLQVTTLRLSNGFTVWLNEDHTQPKVYGAVVVKAGGKDCPNTGIAHYFEHILFKGTDKIGTVNYAKERPWLDSISTQYDLLARTSDPAARTLIQQHINKLSIKAADYAIPNEFENLITTYGGTGLNAYTTLDETVYHNYFAPQYIVQWCELNSERLINPVFRLFQGELETVYEEKNMQSDNMLLQAAAVAQARGFAGTPYAWPVMGSTENLKNPRLSDMQRFYNAYYVAGNMGLILSGDIQASSLRPLLERTFGRIKAGQAPASAKSVLPNFRGTSPLKLKLPIPVMKAEGYAFKGPDEHNADYMPVQVMLAMLNNHAQAGLLDSLTNAHLMMAAQTMSFNFKDFSAFGFGCIPLIPFGSKRKAARLCWQQINRLRTGNFPDEMLSSAKLSLRRNFERELEGIDKRSEMMIDAFSHDLTWSEILQRGRQLEAVTRNDIMRVARQYINDDSLKLVKTYGSYPKERVTQPGYQPVKPVNSGRRSAYADSLARIPFTKVEPRLVDFKHDATCRQLRPLVKLYTVKNPQNDVFTLQLIYRRGTRSDKRLEAMAEYLNHLGTDSLKRSQFVRALYHIGASINTSSSSQAVTVTLTGFDHLMQPAMAVLHNFLTCPKADKRAFNNLVQDSRMEEKTFFKENSNIANALLGRVAYGDSSSYLCRMTAGELKKQGGEALVTLFKDVQRSQLDVVYTGQLADSVVERMVKSYVPIGQVSRPWRYIEHKLLTYNEPLVYVFNNPKARQTIISTYQNVPAMRTPAERSRFKIWANYFGGGMSSVLFQDIREFRALAYSAQGSALLTDLKLNPDSPCAFVTSLGTQSDKAMRALGVLDSIFTDMPLRPANVDATRQQIINSVNNSYPSFRNMGSYVANQQLYGYTEDADKYLVELLPAMGIADVTAFYEQNIQKAPRVTTIVGNKANLDMKQLSRLGRVIECSRSDIFRSR